MQRSPGRQRSVPVYKGEGGDVEEAKRQDKRSIGGEKDSRPERDRTETGGRGMEDGRKELVSQTGTLRAKTQNSGSGLKRGAGGNL
mgnify:CR=1 FL=1